MKNFTSPTLIDFENWLNSFLNFEKLPQKNMFWLDTMETLCKLSGNINTSCPSIHVAGSKGKGSTAAFISSILNEAGLKTGLYTSPHIKTFFERITQNQKLFSPSVYEKSAKELMELINTREVKRIQKERNITWFELVTMYAFFCFKNAKTDAAVYEVGLGGRLDATNVIKPLVCCINTIELEHTEFLGDSLEKIAEEKGGIIKENTPVIIAEQSENVKKVFRKIAHTKNAPIIFVDEICPKISIKFHTYSYKLSKNNLMSVEIESPLFERPLKTNLKMAGEFQAKNAALAALAVKKAFPQINLKKIEKGLSKAYLPARFEVSAKINKFNKISSLILDGAHTVKSIQNTLDTMQKCFSQKNQKRILLFACAADKDIDDIAPLFKNKFDKIYLTKPGSTKLSDLKKIKNAFDRTKQTYDIDENHENQINKALSQANNENALILVTGSFYLVAEVKKIIDK